MRAPLPLAAAVGAIVFALGLLVPTAASAQGGGEWIKFLFTPQAGVNSACLSCGWHSGACGTTAGPALDFAGGCSDGGGLVYFRTFAFLPPGSAPRYVGEAAYYMPAPWQCKEVQAKIWDTEGNLLGRMRYVHADPLYLGTILLLASADGLKNELPFAEMANPDNQTCIDAGWWSPGGVHVHEMHLDGTSTFFLRSDGGCAAGYPTCGTYPCAPQPYPYSCYYNPQDWWNDWARGFCIDDTDCDGWTDSEESYLGTDPLDDCPDHSSDDAWPLDNNVDTAITVVGDVLAYSGNIGAAVSTNPSVLQRLDLNTDGAITVVGDVLLYAGMIGESCT